MRIFHLIPIIFLVATISGYTQQPVVVADPFIITNPTTIVDTPTPSPTPTPTIPVSTEPSYPKPSYTPTIREWVTDVRSGIIIARDPSSYITPNNEWVKYYASQLFIDTDGEIKYKNTKIPWLVNYDSKILLWTEKPLVNNYTLDVYNESYGSVSVRNVPWLMPDYYLTHGLRGVCSAWAATVTSMMLSGEMSVKNDKGEFIKQVIPAKMVLGKMKDKYDGWTEYEAYNGIYITTTSIDIEAITGNAYSQTLFINKATNPIAKYFSPRMEFTDEYFRTVG